VADAHSQGGRLGYWLRSSLVGASIGLCVVAIGTLALEAVDKLDNLRTANSDNVNWTLSQLEVELLQLEIALLEAGQEAQLSDVRRRFDVFYSRLSTIANGAAYATLRQQDTFAEPLARIRDFLDRTVPLIDGPPAQLEASLPALRAEADSVHAAVRAMALSGLEQFARLSDKSRESIAATLLHLALLTSGLVLALTLLLILLQRLIRISDRQAQTQRITASRLQTIIATSLDAVVVVDRDGIIREFNGAAERVFGYTRDEAMGHKIVHLIIPDKYRAAHLAGMKRHQETGERRVIGAGRLELEALRKSGEVFPVELSVDAADDHDGEIFVAYMRDITDRRRAEAELVEARDKALMGEKAKAEFLAVMSHEMRTPLNGLLGTLSLLRDTELTGAQQTYVDIMDTSGKLLLHHVNDVLDISKFEAGKIELARTVFDLDELLQEIVDNQQGVAASHGNSLTRRWVGPEPGCVVGDPVRLRQVMLNLVGNALKFTRNGEVTIEAETETSSGEPTVEFRVIDSGIGIAESDLEKIFSDFKTLDSTYGRQSSGTGLGLGIARRLTLAMGGEIGAESVEREGSVFWVRLPMETRERQDPVADDIPTGRVARALNILVVEDNRINRVVLRDMLERDGHTVTEAEDGEQGVALAETTRFDVILMDISMPVMDGVAATRAIRDGSGASRAAPILAVTAHALPEDVEEFRAAGMTGHLTKPIDRAALADILHRHAGGGFDAPAPAPDVRTPASLLDADKIAELRGSLGDAPYNSLLERFGQEADDAILKIGRHGAEMSKDEVVSLLHRLAGSAGTLGIARLHQELSLLQTQAKQGNALDPAEVVDRVGRIWSETRDALDERLPG